MHSILNILPTIQKNQYVNMFSRIEFSLRFSSLGCMAAAPGWPASTEIHTPWNQGPSAQWQAGISGGPDLDKCATSHLVTDQKLWSESDNWQKYIP